MEATIDLDRIYDTLTAGTTDATLICDAIDDDRAVRDAIITLITNPTITRDGFHLLAKRPHTTEARELTEKATVHALQHPEDNDVTRITHAAEAIGLEADKRRDPQAHATCAYLYWLTGRDAEAAGHALTALALDEDTSLAALVITAIQQGVRR